MKPFFYYFAVLGWLATVGLLTTMAQKASKPAPRLIMFAVLNGGTQLEPIGFLADGKLSGTEEGNPDPFEGKTIKPFFAPKRSYSIVFGGATDGSARIVKQFTGDCAGLSAQITSSPQKAKLKGFVMALATNAPIGLKTPSVRRAPSSFERTSAETLAREELVRRKISRDASKTIEYHNLTAIDVDRDGKLELVGSFFVTPKVGERATLFFVAEKNVKGAYEFTHTEFEKYTADNVMSGEVKDLDDGVYHTLLLDYFDVDGDGTGEIFTTTQAFEGRNFDVYKKKDGKWSNVYEAYNYRCGY